MTSDRSAFILTYLCLSTFTFSNAANILLMMGCPSPSHHVWHVVLVNALAERGHNVTVLSTNTDSNAPLNVTYIEMEGVYDVLYKEHDINLVEMHKETPFESVLTLYGWSQLACVGCLRSRGVRQLLAYPNDFKFDLIINDFTLGPCLLGFLRKFNYPPLIGTTAFNNPTYTIEILGGHNYYAYVPYHGLNYDVNMSFFQRINNIIVHAYDYYHRNYVTIPALHKLAQPVFGADLPYVGDLEHFMKLALVNSNPAIDFPEPLPPNIIPVAGLQVLPVKPLAADLEVFVASAPKAAVLFSLGTNVRSDQLGSDKQRILLEAFAQMPEYHFLWKFETDTLPVACPANVMVRKWLPQNDLLGHSKVRAFITHAGSLSTHEATWHGVPMVAIPFFVDQVRNSHKSREAGVLEIILFPEISTELVIEKVRAVLEDPSYRHNMEIRSIRFRDQPQLPIVRAVWWIEYMLRQPDPKHLASPVLTIGPFAANLYDIQLFAVLVVLLLGFGLRRLLMVIQKTHLKTAIDRKTKTN